MTETGERTASVPSLRVLFIAFEFPPLATGGVHRALAWARELPTLGIELDIVTVRPEDYPAWSSAPLDTALGGELPAGVRVHRISSGFPAWYWKLTRHRLGFRLAQYLYWGDPVSLFWRRPLLAKVDTLVAERHFDVLLTTAPPFGVAVLGRRIARRFRLPWVADQRDAWTRWCVGPYPSVAHYLYTRAREAQVVRDANVAVATSHVTRSDWLADIHGAEPGRLVTIHNGYDASPEIGAPAIAPPPRGRTRQVVYVGSFYYSPELRAATFQPFWRRRPQQWLHYRLRREDWLYRSPYYFLRGVQRLRSTRPELAERLRVTFVGTVASWLPGMLRETGTADGVALTGPLSHEAALARVRSADAVLLTSAKVNGGRDYSIAGKTYEYFAARVPIIAVLTDGAMRDLVVESGLGLFADPDDPDAVAETLSHLLRADDPRDLVKPNETFIARFDRRVIAARMAATLRRAASEGPRV